VNLGLGERVVFVAGASRGIGRAIAKEFALEGARVAIGSRGEGDLVHAADDLRACSAVELLPICGDLTRAEDIDRSKRVIEARWGVPDVLVANVGSGKGPTGWDPSESDWDMSLDVNFRGTVRLVRAFLPEMVSRRSGVVILIGSIAGLEATMAPMPYAAAKSALAIYTKSLARRIGVNGIRVNMVAPGNILFTGGRWEQRQKEDPAGVARMLTAEVSLARFGRPEEIGSVVAFLASDRASFVTGACVVADGGQTRGM
jgi:3-oxoacyl-[acyl-carrier protein] reductase